MLGAVFGCFVSYAVLRDALAARARHKMFELLEASDVVQQERKSAQEKEESFFRPWEGPWDQYREAPKDTAAIWKTLGFERREELLSKMTPEQKRKLRTVIEEQAQQSEQDPYAEIAMPISTVNRGGLKTIVWNKDYTVYSIETEDGATLYPTPKPKPWPYLLAVALPLLGFAVPWGSVLAISWVASGFLEKST